MTGVLDGILRLPPLLALAAVFALPALEASVFLGVLVPGEVGVVLGGVLADQHRLPLAAVLLAGVAGAVVGDSVGYLVGRRYGRRLLLALPRRVVTPAHVARTEESITRLGGRAVFVGRFTAALRALVPGLAGMARMQYSVFLRWNLLGGTLWASGFVLLGYLAGSQFQRAEHYANGVGIGLLAVVVVALALRRRTSRRAEPPAPG